MNVDPPNLDPEESENISGPELPDHLIAKLRVNIPGYELLDKIDTGGQATVYRAKEFTSGLTVAIKVLNGGPNANDDARDRLMREAAALRALNHPNIVCVIEAGQTPVGLDFIVMNYVDGRPLDALWTDRKFAAAIAPQPPAKLRLFQRICEIVQSAHLKGITHRDLSPSNILITADGEPHILDFGLASTAFDDLLSAGRNVTVTGQFIGKVKYAAPEQARGSHDEIDIRTDVYALGVILYQILTDGAFPYEVVGALVDVLNNIIHSQPSPLSIRLSHRAASAPIRQKNPPLVNETIEAVVLKALEKNPVDRYQSAGALAADIHQYLEGRPTAAVARHRKATGSSWLFRNQKLLTALVFATFLTGILMNARTLLTWIGLSATTLALGAGPTPPSAKGPAAHTKPAAMPGPRLEPKIGASPKSEFKTAGHTYKIQPNQPGVAAVRSLPPKAYEPAARARKVSAFYRDQLAKDVLNKEMLERLNVGPFRHEFVWWAWHHWELRDRAWWAWNNYAYFDAPLWQEWMLDHDLAKMIAQFDAAHKQRVPGLIPETYAGQAVEIIYNDEYIEAVYNPTPTPPSIVVDSTASVQLSNLLEGTTRVFGKKTQTIGLLNDRIRRYEFISLPADFDPTYQIDVKRDGDLYVFGPAITPANEAFGADAAKWIPVANQISGPGIQVVYQRQVKAGEKIHLHGVEWSIASEQIELFSPASPEALAAARHVVRDLEQMTGNKGDFVGANPSLADYIQESHDVAVQLVTANNNINDDAVADCHYELGHLEQMSEADLIQTSDPRLANAGKDFVGRVKSLQESLNAVDELRDPSAPDPTLDLTTLVEPVAIAVPGQKTVDLMKLVDPAQDTAHGRWEISRQHLFGAGGEKWCEIAFPYIPPSEYDYKVVFVRNSGDEPFCQLFVGGVHRIAWWIGKENTKAYFSPVTNWDKGVKAVKSTERIKNNWIINGQEYTSILRVRKDGVEALLNGESVCKWPTNYADLKSNGWPKGKDGTIQVGFNGLHSTYTIESVWVTEISGQGQCTRK